MSNRTNTRKRKGTSTRNESQRGRLGLLSVTTAAGARGQRRPVGRWLAARGEELSAEEPPRHLETALPRRHRPLANGNSPPPSPSLLHLLLFLLSRSCAEHMHLPTRPCFPIPRPESKEQTLAEVCVEPRFSSRSEFMDVPGCVAPRLPIRR
jgi:hypothetical protein